MRRTSRGILQGGQLFRSFILSTARLTAATSLSHASRQSGSYRSRPGPGLAGTSEIGGMSTTVQLCPPSLPGRPRNSVHISHVGRIVIGTL
eukprot:8516085-Pyramimonas_sp.AAC.1